MADDALSIIRRQIANLTNRFRQIGERIGVDVARFIRPTEQQWQQTARTNRLILPDGTTATDLANLDITGRGEPYQVVVKGTPISDTPSGYNTVDIDPSEFPTIDEFLDAMGLTLGDLREVRFDRG